MRKRGLILGLLLAAFLAGCSQQTEPTVADDGQKKAAEETAVPTVEGELKKADQKTDDELAESGEDSSDTAKETPGSEEKTETEEAAESGEESKEELNELTGTIKSFTGGYLYLEPDDGSDTLEFNLSEAELECENGILSGEHVAVFYEGEVKGWDTSAVQVRRITEQADQEKLGEESMVGTVVKATTNTLSIRKEEEDIITFITAGANLQCSNGLELGNWVNVTYLGKIQGNNAKNVKVISVSDTDEVIAEERSELAANPMKKTMYAAENVHIHEDSCADSPVMDTVEKGTELDLIAKTGFGWVQIQYEGMEGYVFEEYLEEADQKTSGGSVSVPEWEQEEEKEMTADLLSVDRDTITVKSEEGRTYAFSCVGTKIDMRYGLLEGSEIVLKYQGQASAETDTARLLSVADVDPEVVSEKTGGFSVTGTVMAFGVNAMTIMSDDGAQITFTTENAVMEKDFMPEEGAYVAVVVEPSGKSNVYKALSIESVY